MIGVSDTVEYYDNKKGAFPGRINIEERKMLPDNGNLLAKTVIFDNLMPLDRRNDHNCCNDDPAWEGLK